MSMIDRYKKKGGFVQLLNLIETTGKEKAERFLKMIAEESPVWEAEIRRKSLSLDRLSTWNQTYLMEVVPRLPPNVLGTALYPMPPEKQQVFLGALAFGERRKTEDFMKEAKPNGGEIAACQMKLLTEVRQLVASGGIKLDKCDPELAIPENIEEQLNAGQGSAPLNFHPAGGSGAPDAHSSVSHTAPPAGTPANVQEELLQLRRRVMALTQENQTLKSQMQTMKEKIDQIRKVAA